VATAFPGASVIDRRDNPSHGYRAVHIIAEISGKPVEIQVWTALQHLWAEVSEKSSDVLDPTIKYGGGPESWRNFLTKSSASVAACEKAEAAHEVFEKAFAKLLEHDPPDHEVQELRGKLEESRAERVRCRNANADLLNEMISWLDERAREQKQ